MNGTARHASGSAAAPAADQVDVLLGLLIEQAQIAHGLMGGEARHFDYDQTRTSLLALAAAPAGTNSRADRYRTLARRGVHASRAQVGDRPVDNLPPCSHETDSPAPGRR